jgi:hypothetical protein
MLKTIQEIEDKFLSDIVEALKIAKNDFSELYDSGVPVADPMHSIMNIFSRRGIHKIIDKIEKSKPDRLDREQTKIDRLEREKLFPVTWRDFI